MQFEAFGKPKSKEELGIQAQKAERVLGKDMYPPDTDFQDLDILTMQEKYKTRYNAYVSTLRAGHQGKLDTNDIKHAKEWIVALNNLDKYIKEHESQDDPLLREKQYIVYKKIRDFLEQGKREGYVKLPTGVGKTILFAKIAEALDMKTLIAAPSIAIMTQNNKEVEKYTDSDFGTYYELNKDLDKKVTNITYQSLVNAVRNQIINPEDIPVLILDEVHRSLGPERAETVNKFKGLKLGFTATSEFSGKKKVSHLLEEEIFRMDIKDAISEGLACQTQTIHSYTSIDLSGVDVKNGDYDKEELEKAVNVPVRNIGALKLYKEKFSHLKIFVNCSGVQHAKNVAKLFNENGISAYTYTNETKDGKEEGQREWILENYANGNIKVLVNARALLEGFNDPSCSVTFNLHPTLSFVDAEQRARSGRLNKNDRDKWNYVVDFIDKDSKKPQILYSEILGADRVWDISITRPKNQEQEQKSEIEPRPPINFDDFHIDELKVVVDPQEIMEVTNQNIDFRQPKEDWTIEDLQADMILKGIKSSQDYIDNSKQNNWPSYITLVSMPEFPKTPDGSNDWDAFLSRERKEKWTFETLRADVRAKGIKSSGDYLKNSKQNNWPSAKTLFKKPESPKNPDGSNDWYTFLGIKKQNFETLRADVIAKGIKSSKEYSNNVQENKWFGKNKLISMPEFPKTPDGSNDWDAFLSRERKEKWTFETLRADVRAKGIKSSGDYLKNSKQNNWPSAKTLFKKPESPKNPDGSNDWYTFLGIKKQNFETLRADVIAKGIKSSKEYSNNVQENKWFGKNKLISMPEFPKTPDGSNDWDAFLSRERKEKWTFETLRADVRAKGIKSSKEYQKKASQNNWPVIKILTAMPEFPKKPDGSNDWDKFLNREKFDFEKFRTEVIAKGTKSSFDYLKNSSQHNWPTTKTLTAMPEFPKKPDGSNDWGTFLGKKD